MCELRVCMNCAKLQVLFLIIRTTILMSGYYKEYLWSYVDKYYLKLSNKSLKHYTGTKFSYTNLSPSL